MPIASSLRATILAGALFLALAVPGFANDDDAALWLVNEIGVPLDDRFSAHVMLQNRWTDDLENYQRTVLRPWITLHLPHRVQLAVGYDLHAFTNPDETEHRAWQRIGASYPIGGATLLGHFWLEERFLPGASAVAVRGRFNLGASFDLGNGFSLVARNELFVDFNETSRIRRKSVGENQFVVSLSKELGSGVHFNIGYLQQYLDVRGDENLVYHTLNTGFSWTTPTLFDGR